MSMRFVDKLLYGSNDVALNCEHEMLDQLFEAVDTLQSLTDDHSTKARVKRKQLFKELIIQLVQSHTSSSSEVEGTLLMLFNACLASVENIPSCAGHVALEHDITEAVYTISRRIRVVPACMEFRYNKHPVMHRTAELFDTKAELEKRINLTELNYNLSVFENKIHGMLMTRALVESYEMYGDFCLSQGFGLWDEYLAERGNIRRFVYSPHVFFDIRISEEILIKNCSSDVRMDFYERMQKLYGEE